VTPSNVLFVLTIYNDYVQAGMMLQTLKRCAMPKEGSKWQGMTRLLVEDASEEPRTAIDAPGWTYQANVPGRRMGLPEALNHASAHAIERGFDYLSWIHPDMDFSEDPQWLAQCILWLERHDLCGKASPQEYKTVEDLQRSFYSTSTMSAHKGNACPWIVRVSDLQLLRAVDGWVFDPNYKLMHFEDWDFINRLQTELGKTADILPWARVVHEGMGTRKDHDYEDSLAVNRQYYEEKWGMKGIHL
jgi:hypothetical protein